MAKKEKKKAEVKSKIEVNQDELVVVGAYRAVISARNKIKELKKDAEFKKKREALNKLQDEMWRAQDKYEEMINPQDEALDDDNEQW